LCIRLAFSSVYTLVLCIGTFMVEFVDIHPTLNSKQVFQIPISCPEIRIDEHKHVLDMSHNFPVQIKVGHLI